MAYTPLTARRNRAEISFSAIIVEMGVEGRMLTTKRAVLNWPWPETGYNYVATWQRLILSNFAQSGFEFVQVIVRALLQILALDVHEMPTVSVDRDDLFERLEKKYSQSDR